MQDRTDIDSVAATGSLDASLARRNFSRAAESYDAAAGLQSEVRARLMHRIGPLEGSAGRVLDLGCGTGVGFGALAARLPAAQVFGCDIAFGMAAAANERAPGAVAVADAEQLPFGAASFDLIFSSMALQWCADLPRALLACSERLRPAGRLLVSMPAPGTLSELRGAWATVDGATHVHEFPEPARVCAAAQDAGLEVCHCETFVHRQRYSDLIALMKNLQRAGAGNVSHMRPRALKGRAVLARLSEAYPNSGGGDSIWATWNILYADFRKRGSTA